MSQATDAHLMVQLPRWIHPLTSAVTTGIMSGAVSGMATARTLGMDRVLAAPSLFLNDWARAFVFSWPLAFVIFTLFMPPVRRVIVNFARAVSVQGD